MPTPSSRPLTISLLRLYLDDHAYCIESSFAPSIRRAEELTHNNSEAGPAIGAIAVGGRRVAVYSLRERLGLGEPLVTEGPIAILDSGRSRFGVQADRVSRPVTVPIDSVSMLPELVSRGVGVLRGATHIDGALTLFLSASAMSPSSDISEVQSNESFQRPPAWTGGIPSAENRLLCCTDPSGDASTIFGFSLRQLLEVVEDLTVIPCGGRSPCITGVTEWRGFLAPVISLRALLGPRDEQPPASDARLAILRGVRRGDLFAVPGQSFVTLAVPYEDKLGEMTPLPPPGELIRSAYRAGNRMIVAPDLDRLAELASA